MSPPSKSAPSRRPALLLAVVGILGLIASIPITWQLTLSARADRIDAIVEQRMREHVALDSPARGALADAPDCETAQELARRYPSRTRIAPDAELVNAVQEALSCRRAWNVEIGFSQWLPARVDGTILVAAYLRARPTDDPDACLDGAATALRLADRLQTGGAGESDMQKLATERILACADRASPTARVSAAAEVAALAFDPSPVWAAAERAVIGIASVYADDLRNFPFNLLRSLLEHPRSAPELLWELRFASAHEGRAYDVLAITDELRACDDACLVAASEKGRSYVTAYSSGGPSSPLAYDLSQLLWS